MFHTIAQESYLEAYCKFLYYSCLIPFKPVWKLNGKLLVLNGNGIHKVLCIIVNSLVLVDHLHKLLTFQETLNSSPLVLFKYAGIVLGLFVISSWNICFWRKTNQLTKLIYQTSTNCSIPDNISFKFKKIAMFLSPVIIFILGYLCELKIWNGRVRLPYDIDKISMFTSELKWSYLLLLLKQIPLCCSIYMGTCFDVLTIVIAVSVYDFANTHFENTKKNSDQPNISKDVENKPNIRKIVKVAKEIKCYFGNLNDFYSNLFLFWFCIQFPWIPLQLVRLSSIEECGIIEVISIAYTWICTSFYVATGILYSESRKKAMQFKTDAIEHLLEDPYNIDTRQNLIKYFEVTLEDAIIKGGNYVRISYKFLGSVVSALIGYGFLVLQFRSSSSVFSSNEFSD